MRSGPSQAWQQVLAPTRKREDHMYRVRHAPFLGEQLARGGMGSRNLGVEPARDPLFRVEER